MKNVYLNLRAGFSELKSFGALGVAAMLLGAILSSWSAPALAQGETGTATTVSSGVLDEIFVEGTRQITQLQTTPVAISVIGSEQFEGTFARDIRGIAHLLPNVIIEGAQLFNASAIAIRGAGTQDIITTVDSAVGIVLDGFALPHIQSQLLDPFDLEQVEVLRGPQGTLFGKNTTGGVILLRSKKPVLDEFGGRIQGTAGNLGTIEARGSVNIPIIENKLAYRGVFSYQFNHGYFKNDKVSTVFGTAAQPGSPLGLPANGDGRNLSGRDVFYSKQKFLYGTDNYEALLTFEFLRDRSPTRVPINETPANGVDSFGIQRNFLFNTLGFPGILQTCAELTQECIFSTGVSGRNDGLQIARGNRVDAFGVYLEQEITFDLGTLTIFGGYRHQNERLAGGAGGEAWPSLLDFTRNVERDMIQGEARFSSTLDGPFQFTVGAAYFVNNLDFRSLAYNGLVSVPINLGGCDVVDPSNTPGSCLVIDPAANDRASFSHLNQDGDAYGIYAEFYYDISEKLRLTFGGRYSYEKKTFDKRGSAVLTPGEIETFLFTDGNDTIQMDMGDQRFRLLFADKNSWDGFTFKGVLDYEIDEDTFVYASFNQGFKSGSYAETCNSVTSCPPFNEEKADSYEVGYKSDLFDNTLRVNLAAFHSKISDVVRSQVVPIIDQFGNPGQETQFRNVAGQKNWGVELELTWYPTDELRIGFVGSWLDAAYTSFITQVNSGADFSGSLTPECFDIDAVGNDDAKCLGIVPNAAPEWKIGGTITYTMSLGNAGTLIWYGGVQWQPEYEFNLFNQDNTQAQSRTLVDLNLTYRDSEERYQLAFFVKNLLNETFRTAANSIAGLFTFSNYGAPRRYGAELTVNF